MKKSRKEQRQFLVEHGEKEPIYSYNQTDFVKEKIAVEVQFGKYAFVAYDLFVKHMLFYSGGVIDLGIEILPTKKMQAQMSSGVAYYEGEVYNVMRQGRNNPPVLLLILGIEPYKSVWKYYFAQAQRMWARVINDGQGQVRKPL